MDSQLIDTSHINTLHINTLHREALALHHTGKFAEAEATYRQFLAHHPDDADAWRNLGLVYYSLGCYADAKQALQTSLALDASKAVQHYSLGLALEKLEDWAGAIQAYQQALTIEPDFIDAYSVLGNLLETMGQAQQAAALYRQAIATDASYIGGYLNLGNILLAQGQLDEAIRVYKQALALQPTNADSFYNLGIAFDHQQEPIRAAFCYAYAAFYQRDYATSATYFEQVLATEVLEKDCYLALVTAYTQINQPDDAVRACQMGLQHYPTSHELYIEYLRTLHHFQREQEALTIAQQASQVLPDELVFRFYQTLFLPIIYNTSEDLVAWRQRFTDGIAALAQVSIVPGAVSQTTVRAVQYHNNFYLQYQGYNDLELQRQYGAFVQRVMTARYPDWCQPRPMPDLAPGERIRIIYISEGFSYNVAGLLLPSLYRYADRQHFQIYTYFVNEQADHLTDQFRLYSDVFRQLPESIDQVCQQITLDAPHIIVFPAIGMRPFITQLACLRLAPVQCATWLHPTTSGLATIDYFLSSDAMEPDNAQEHYSETLVRLPNLGIPYPTPALPPQTCQRADLHLPEDTLLYLCCQAIAKYLPQHDYLYVEIARQMPQAKLVFVTRCSTSVAHQFRQRLQQAFAMANLNYADSCIFMPRLPREHYFDLMRVSDVFLDTLAWSGGVTSAEAIACGLPIVTCPGELMRGRQSAGMLTLIGVTDTIARTEQEYIDIAVRLGRDRAWRADVKTRLEQHGARLYDDRTCVSALEAFYRQIVMEGIEQKS